MSDLTVACTNCGRALGMSWEISDEEFRRTWGEHGFALDYSCFCDPRCMAAYAQKLYPDDEEDE